MKGFSAGIPEEEEEEEEEGGEMAVSVSAISCPPVANMGARRSRMAIGLAIFTMGAFPFWACDGRKYFRGKSWAGGQIDMARTSWTWILRERVWIH